MIPRTAVFDLGKVLVDFDFGIAAARFQKRCRVSEGELRKALDQSTLLHRYEAGELSTAQFFDTVRSLSKFDGTLPEFRAIFGDIFTPIPSMIALHAALRSAGIPTFVFSNTNEIAADHIRENFPFFGTFDGHILSFEHGAMKPDERLYRVVEKVSGCSGQAILYLDDRPENIAAGQRLGWQSIHHRDPDETMRAVRRFGLLSEARP